MCVCVCDHKLFVGKHFEAGRERERERKREKTEVEQCVRKRMHVYVCVCMSCFVFVPAARMKDEQLTRQNG